WAVMKFLHSCIPIAFSALAALQTLAGQTVTPEHEEFFEKRIRPILAARCHSCHNVKSASAGLNLTTGSGFRKGADTGPLVAPGDPEKSRLLQVVGYQERIKMPPT